jgi:fermentation-respiration switch protein FrsA (DUF1100 family)
MIEHLVRQFLYYPTRIPESAPLPPWVQGAAEVWFDTSEGDRIHGLHWPAPPSRPTVLYLHGNAQTVFEWSLVASDLAPLDAGLLLIDYPGYGKSTGSPHEEALYAAGHAALDWLGERVVAERTVVLGKSLGGGVATEVLQNRPVMGLILESTFCSVPAVARQVMPFVPAGALLRTERYDSLSRVPGLRLPVLVVHGTADDLIPVEQGRALYDAANDPKELYLVEGAGHNDVTVVAGPAYGERLRRWLETLG